MRNFFAEPAVHISSAQRPDRFTRQFLIFAAGNPHLPAVPETFKRYQGQTITIAACPTQPVVPLVDATDEAVGFVLGQPVEIAEARLLNDQVRLETQDGAGVEAAIEALYQRLGGPFLIVLDGYGLARTYLDACGSMSLVYDPETRIAAATAGLLLDDAAYEARFDRALYEHLNILRDGWFPAGLTAHAGIKRQLVNHCLDLAAFTQARHWPHRPIEIADDPAAAIGEICRTSRAIIDAFRAEGDLAFGLTAGNETRMLLAICRDIASELSFTTVDHPANALDVVRAKEIAARFGLRHSLLPVRFASDRDAAQWHARSGHCIGGPNMKRHATVLELAEARAFVGGLGGEIGRGFFWRAGDSCDTEINADTIVARFGMPPSPQVHAAVEEWRRSVTAFDPFLALDLAYMELRMGCWAFAQAYTLPEVSNIHPLISRPAFTAMLSLPPEWRRQNRMPREAIAQTWPELLALPFNRYGDYRDTLNTVSRAIRQPHLVAKKARKMFA